MDRNRKSLVDTTKYFGLGNLKTSTKLKGGLVNISYDAITSSGRYVIQRLSAIFDSTVIDDYCTVQSYLRTADLQVPVLLSNGRKEPYLILDDGLWRVFEYIPNDVVNEMTPEIARGAGKLLGRFHNLMGKSDFKPKFKLDGFHDSRKTMTQLEELMSSKTYSGKSKRVGEEYGFVKDNIEKFFLPEDREKIVIHGDPKKENFLFRNGMAIAMVDLDTMMEESELIDLGDALRSWCRNPLGFFNKNVFRNAMAGYCMANDCNYSEREILNATGLITLELAARFLKDYFEESYFAWNREKYRTSAEHNLDRVGKCLAYHRSFAQFK